MVRALLVAPAGLLLALLLFYVLAMISGTGSKAPVKESFIPDLDFQMVRQDALVEVRKRELPPEPEEIVPQDQPQLPQVQQQTFAINTPAPSINVPNIDVGVQIALSPSLNNLTMPVPEMVLDTNPTAISQVPPSYPRRALRRKIEGSVTVEFIVTESGSVKPGSIVVVDSKPKGEFDSAVMRAIQKWRFKTRVVDGKAVPFKARQSLEFKLER